MGSGGYVQLVEEALGLRNCAHLACVDGIFLGPTLIARAGGGVLATFAVHYAFDDDD